jgi:MtN3 and saliva related transmembrane protein
LLWLVYGLLLGRPAIVLANGITLTLALAVLALKLRFG